MSSQSDEDYRDFKFEDDDHSTPSTDEQENLEGDLLTKQLTRSTNENPVGYSEAYQELFNSTIDNHDHTNIFQDSQLGSVLWSAEEKSGFFKGLALKGRHDLASLSQHIGTKSVLEVRDYLLRIQNACADRQRFEKYTKAVSSADIEAAAEISPELESLLENAADALAQTQNRYDIAQAANKPNLEGPWIYDAQTAQETAQQLDLQESAKPDESDVEAASEPVHAPELFHIESMLELSRNLFMNTAQSRLHDHWHELADDTYCEPMIMAEALETLYSLIKSFTQRVLQNAIFLAKSRMRATTGTDRRPRALLREVDITAALDVMDVPRDSFEYWTGFPRRSGVKVYLGEHDRGKDGQRTLTSQEIANVLTVRAIRGRRRSLSSMISMSSQNNDELDLEDDSRELQVSQNSDAVGAEEDTEGSHYDESDSSASSHAESEQFTTSDTDPEVVDPAPDTGRGQKHLIADAEDEEEKFLENLDQRESLNEEQQLRDLLGLPAFTGEISDDRPGKRPKIARKTKEELLDWTSFVYPEGWSASINNLREVVQDETFDHEST